MLLQELSSFTFITKIQGGVGGISKLFLSSVKKKKIIFWLPLSFVPQAGRLFLLVIVSFSVNMDIIAPISVT